MAKKHFLFFYFVAVTSMLLWSCNKDNTDDSSQNKSVLPETSVRAYEYSSEDATIEMKENAIFVRSDVEEAMESFDAEEGLIVFSSNEALEKLDLKSGDILYSTTCNEMHPDGYCVRITDIKATQGTRAGEAYACTVEDVSLLEAFDRLHDESIPDIKETTSGDIIAFNIEDQFKFGWTFDGVNKWGVYPHDSNTSLKLKDTKVTYGAGRLETGLDVKTSTFTIGYKLFEDKETGESLKLTADIKLDFDSNVFDIDWGKISIDGDFNWSAIGKIEYESKNSTEKDIVLSDKAKKFTENLLNKKFEVVEFALPWPASASVVLRPKFQLLAEFKLDITGKLVVEFGLRDGQLHYDFTNHEAWSTEMNQPMIKEVKPAKPVFNVTGEIKGKASAALPVGVIFEIPTMKYRDNADAPVAYTWNDYNARKKKTSYVGVYLTPKVELDIDMKAKWDAINHSSNLNFSVNPFFVLGVRAEWLIGIRTKLIAQNEHSFDFLKIDFGTYTWIVADKGNGVFLSYPDNSSALDPQSKGVELKWISTFDANSKVDYSVYAGIKNDKSKMKLEGNVTDEYSFLFEPYTCGTYYWYVKAKTGEGNEYESDVWCFDITNVQITDDPVACFLFNGNCDDCSGNGNNGILEGNAPQLTTDRFGRENSAYYFGGYYNPGWIRVPNNESLHFHDAFSVSAWIQLGEYGGMEGWGRYSTADASFNIIGKAGDGNATSPGLYLICSYGSNHEGDIRVGANNSNGNAHYESNHVFDISATAKYNSGEWAHLAVTQKDDYVMMYINGEVVIEKDCRNANFTSMNQQDLFIGIMGSNYPNWYPMFGKIDDVRLYSRAISTTEVRSLYHEGGY